MTFGAGESNPHSLSDLFHDLQQIAKESYTLNLPS